VVCINRFTTDTAGEVKVIKRAVEANGRPLRGSTHWAHGGEGALELADMIIDACKKSNGFQYLYPQRNEIKAARRKDRDHRLRRGRRGTGRRKPKAKAEYFESDPKYDEYSTMMVKTQLSLTHMPDLKGVPKGWRCPSATSCSIPGEIPLSLRRDDQPDAGHRLRPGVPACRR